MQNAAARYPRPASASLTTSRDIANSNSTSNFFLGIPQRSWMSGANVQPHPTQPRFNTRKRKSPTTLEEQSNAVDITSTPPSGADANHCSDRNNPQSTEDRTMNFPQPTSHLPSPPRSEYHHEHSHVNVIPQGDGTPMTRRDSISGRPQSPIRQTANQVLVPTPVLTPQNQGVSLVEPSARNRAGNEDDLQHTPHLPRTTPQQSMLFEVNADNELFVASIGGWGSLDETSSTRLHMIRAAIQEGDEFYLILHQLLCIASFNQIDIYRLPYMREPQLVGLNTLAPLFTDNTLMRREVLSHCASHPYSLTFLIHGYLTSPLLQYVTWFLGLFGQAWPQYSVFCLDRQCPPFPEEQFNSLGIRSPLLQTIVFTALHRQLGAPDNAAWSQQCQRIFTESQMALKRTAQNPTAVQGNQIPLSHRIAKYRQIRSQALHESNQTSPQRPENCQMSAVHPNHSIRQQSAPDTAFPYQGLPPEVAMTLHERSLNSPSNRAVDLQLPNVPSMLRPGPLPPSSTSGHSINIGTPALVPTSSDTHLPDSFPVQRERATTRTLQDSSNTDALQPASPVSMPDNGNRSVRGRRMPAPALVSLESIRTGPFFAIPDHLMTQSTHPNPCWVALHQAYLNSPIPQILDHTGREVPDIRMYQYLASFALGPKFLGADRSFYSWDFEISAKDRNRCATMVREGTLTEAPKRQYIDQACLFRLRCVSVSPQESSISEHEWNARSAVWPSSCFISCNQHELGLRRKHHYGSDLAVDLTNFIKEGANKITFSILRGEKEYTSQLYAAAVEIIEVGDEQRVRSAVGVISASEALKKITDSLASTSLGDDAEVSVVDPHISIDLMDPFTAKMFEVPVRGRYCKHRECFDLDTFLRTRMSRGPSNLTSADFWKCPICRLDARPASLMIDGFLQEVRQKLQERLTLEAPRAILVKADGTWDVNKEIRQVPRVADKEAPEMSVKNESSDQAQERVYIDLVDNEL